MKKTKFSLCLLLILVSTLHVSNTFAQDSRQWHLPEGAKARLGKGSISEIAFSPDGKLLAVAGGIGIWLYDAQTNKELGLFTRHTGYIFSIAFSPDGKILAGGSSDNTIRFWEVASGSHLRTLTGHTSWVSSVVFSPDGKIFAGGSSDNTIWFWDAETGSHLRTLTGHTDYISRIAFCPDGKTLASMSRGKDKTIRLWDVKTGAHFRTLTRQELVYNFYVNIVFSPDGQTLMDMSSDRITLLNTRTGAHLWTITSGVRAWFNSAVFSPDGQTLAVGIPNFTVELWDARTGEPKNTFVADTVVSLEDISSPSSGIRSVVFSPDGQTLVGVKTDETIWFWEVASGAHLRTLTGHTDSVSSVAFSPDGQVITSDSENGFARLWDVRTGSLLRTFVKDKDNNRWNVFSPDGQIRLEWRFGDNKLYLYDVETGSHLRTLGPIYTAALFGPDAIDAMFAPDGQTLVITHRRVLFHVDGLTLPNRGKDKTIELWDVKTGTHLRTLTGHTDSVSDVEFSPDGETLISGSEDGTIRFWSVDTGEHIRTLRPKHQGSVRSFVFSPDRQTLAITFSQQLFPYRDLMGYKEEDKTIELWDVKTGTHLRTLTGHTDWIVVAAFFPDGQTLLSWSTDNTIRLWNVDTGEQLRTLKGHTKTIKGYAFTPDRQTLVSWSADGTILLWDIAPLD